LAPNTPEAVASFYAASQLGVNLSLLHPLSKIEQIEADRKEKNSKLLIIASILLPSLPELVERKIPLLAIETKESLPFLKKLLYPLAMKQDNFSFKDHPEVRRFHNVKKTYQGAESYPSKDGRIFLVSGGTSGKEKSIALSDFAILSLIAKVPYIVEGSEDDLTHIVMLAALPMFHGFGLAMGVLNLLSWGGAVELLPKFRSQKALNALSHKDYQAILIGVPVMFEALLKNPNLDEEKLRRLRIAFVGGDFIAPSLLQRFNAKAEKAGSTGRLFEGYGLTETVTVLSVNRLSTHKEGTIGQCLPGIKALIIDDEGNVLPPNQEGDLVVTGDTLMNGYLEGDDPFLEIAGERYVKTGDIGKIDEDGYLTFISRKKRMIKKKGFNIYPLRIEKRISSIPGVDECAYFARVGERSENTYLYLVIRDKKEKESILEEAKAILRKEFYDYEFPEHLEVKDDLPKTNIGKIDYKVLEKVD
ncbi:MAG: acyl--CoA ligase, partial [Bacilli bacterium]|nr:acyl--CoA ligase [Bacilli bacterium]